MIDATTTPQTLALLVDYSTFPDDGAALVDMTPRRITGARVALEWVARSWLTARRSLRWAPARGCDVRDLENATFGPGEVAAWKQSLISEAMARPFVAACAAAVTLAGRVVTIDGRVALADGRVYPLAMTLSEASAAVQIGATS